MAFSIQNVLRQISADLLKEYLDHKAAGVFHSVWKMPKSRQASTITRRLFEIDDHISQSILADLVRIHPLTTRERTSSVRPPVSACRRAAGKLDLPALLQHEKSNYIALDCPTTKRHTVVCRLYGARRRISSSFHATAAALWAWD
jgi:hypothetical protein